MTRPEHEIDAYLEGTLTDAQARALEAWINTDPANAAAFMHLVQTHQMLGVVGKEQRLAREADNANPEDLDPVTLRALAQMEASAEPVPFSEVEQHFAFDIVEPNHKPHKSVDLAHAMDDLRWALGKATTRLVRSTPFITGSIAAVLLVGLYLFGPWSSTPPTQTPDRATGPIVEAPTTQPVATLTAEHNATWADRALAPGSKLHPNQRFTLTAGFAEITTNRGAIAILEAPTTVELLDNDNAIRLHAGKLVGICETESSKGFLVRTPHMDVTDLGTRFGVDTSDADATQVHVFKGEVEVTRSASFDGEIIRERLTDGQAVESRSGGVLADIRYENDRFAANVRYVHLRPEFAGRSVVWSGLPRGDLRLHAAESGSTQVFLEQANLLLDEDVVVDFNQTQEWAMDSTAGQHVVAAGQRVDVYLIRLDPPGESRINRISEIHFDRPILGVIADESSLRKTDAALGVQGVLYSDLRDAANQRGLDIHLDDTGSVVNNGTSLRLLINATQFLDEVRVLVLAKDAEQRDVDR